MKNLANFFAIICGAVCLPCYLQAQDTPAQANAGPYKIIDQIETDIKEIADRSKGVAVAWEIRDNVDQTKGNVIKTVTAAADAETERNKEFGLGSRSILCLKLGSGPKNILVTGTQHVREWIAYRAALDTAKWLLANQGKDRWPLGPEFDYFRTKAISPKKLFTEATIYFVVVANPSGYAFSRKNDPFNLQTEPNVAALEARGATQTEIQKAIRNWSDWRKNRRDVSTDPADPQLYGTLGKEPPPTDIPSTGLSPILNRSLSANFITATGAKLPIPLVGVDLNRSYPVLMFPLGEIGTNASWGQPNPGAGHLRWNLIYSGTPVGGKWQPVELPPLTPIVEKETQAIMTLAGKPNFLAGYIDLHSYHGFIGFPQGTGGRHKIAVVDEGRPNDNEFFRMWADKAGRLVTGNADGPYVTDPKDPNYLYEKDGVLYKTSGSSRDWLYYRDGSKCVGMLIEIGKKNYHPIHADKYTKGVMPAILYMMMVSSNRYYDGMPGAQGSKTP